jgi:hypothetical protein
MRVYFKEAWSYIKVDVLHRRVFWSLCSTDLIHLTLEWNEGEYNEWMNGEDKKIM